MFNFKEIIMMVLIATAVILTIITLALLIYLSIQANDLTFSAILVVVLLLLFLALNAMSDEKIKEVSERVSRKVYIEQLKGNENPYEMTIHYELKDSIMIPVDTLFTLKKKNEK